MNTKSFLLPLSCLRIILCLGKHSQYLLGAELFGFAPIISMRSYRNKQIEGQTMVKLLNMVPPSREPNWSSQHQLLYYILLSRKCEKLFLEIIRVTNRAERRRQWHPTPVLLPGKSRGWRSLVHCSPWECEELDTTEWLHFHFSLSCIGEGNGKPLQCSCLENPRDGGACWAAGYGVAQSRTRLKQLSSSSNRTERATKCVSGI